MQPGGSHDHAGFIAWNLFSWIAVVQEEEEAQAARQRQRELARAAIIAEERERLLQQAGVQAAAI